METPSPQSIDFKGEYLQNIRSSCESQIDKYITRVTNELNASPFAISSEEENVSEFRQFHSRLDHEDRPYRREESQPFSFINLALLVAGIASAIFTIFKVKLNGRINYTQEVEDQGKLRNGCCIWSINSSFFIKDYKEKIDRSWENMEALLTERPIQTSWFDVAVKVTLVAIATIGVGGLCLGSSSVFVLGASTVTVIGLVMWLKQEYSVRKQLRLINAIQMDLNAAKEISTTYYCDSFSPLSFDTPR
jgi:hypothetical protein